jgi:hypothetical protein
MEKLKCHGGLASYFPMHHFISFSNVTIAKPVLSDYAN